MVARPLSYDYVTTATSAPTSIQVRACYLLSTVTARNEWALNKNMENCQTIAAITTSRRIAPSQEIRNLYLNMCRMEDSGFASDFELDLQPGTQQVTALAAYFDCTFELPLLRCVSCRSCLAFMER
ncbi:uncharacterized protein LOC142558626 isoform X2 [Dermacentor variabilis]|uniref:uncharacterized protein LOC142558626 isoform X2 n=1 Tax=Dermacentor variabilis TaxID=34621 RepID=UPI003F5C37DC